MPSTWRGGAARRSGARPAVSGAAAADARAGAIARQAAPHVQREAPGDCIHTQPASSRAEPTPLTQTRTHTRARAAARRPHLHLLVALQSLGHAPAALEARDEREIRARPQLAARREAHHRLQLARLEVGGERGAQQALGRAAAEREAVARGEEGVQYGVVALFQGQLGGERQEEQFCGQGSRARDGEWGRGCGVPCCLAAAA